MKEPLYALVTTITGSSKLVPRSEAFTYPEVVCVAERSYWRDVFTNWCDLTLIEIAV